jgi:hypothetical protein
MGIGGIVDSKAILPPLGIDFQAFGLKFLSGV